MDVTIGSGSEHWVILSKKDSSSLLDPLLNSTVTVDGKQKTIIDRSARLMFILLKLINDLAVVT